MLGMDEKTLTIRKVENGYIVTLCGCDNKKEESEYHRKEYALKELPAEVQKMFDGNIDGKQAVEPKERERLSFGKAMKEAENMMDEEKDEKEED